MVVAKANYVFSIKIYKRKDYVQSKIIEDYSLSWSNIPNLVVNHAFLFIPLDLLYSLSNDNETIKVPSSF